jgi:hypothetical protein
MSKSAEHEKRRFVRRRSNNPGSVARVAKLSVRMTRATSNRLASIQGLIRAFGRGETIADLFEVAAMPAIAAYVAPYAEAAKAARAAKRREAASC